MKRQRKLRIGTRGSRLALLQAQQLKDALSTLGIESDFVTVTTSGDRIQDRRLADCGGKSLFTKEIDQALLNGDIDLAVHSVKDLEGFLPKGVQLAAILSREDPRDAFVCPRYNSFEDLPLGSIFGTSSPRREAQVLAIRPDFKVTLLRGNVETRLEKIDRGECDFTLLAVAGLKRLGLYSKDRFPPLDMDSFLPCVGQGAIGMTCRSEDQKIQAILDHINHSQSFQEILIERKFLEGLKGGCKTPVAGLCKKTGNDFVFKVFVSREDGSDFIRKEVRGSFDFLLKKAFDLGQEMALWLEVQSNDLAHQTS